MRDQLLRKIAPRARKLGADIIELIVPQLEQAVERAVADSKAKLGADLLALTEPVKPRIAKAPRRKKKRRATASPRSGTAAPAVAPPKAPLPLAKSSRASAPTSSRPVCSVCQQPGHNARTCPKRAAAIATAAPVKDARPRITVDLDKPPPPPRLSTSDRAALEKPCRDPNCRNPRLHAAHGEAA